MSFLFRREAYDPTHTQAKEDKMNTEERTLMRIYVPVGTNEDSRGRREWEWCTAVIPNG